MALSDDQIAFALELLEGVGPLTTRKMFGGLGIYHEGTIFALMMSDGRIMLKGVDEMQARYDALGMERWVYPRKDGGEAAMPYWVLTDAQLDDPESVSDLAREAISHIV